jgi:hypothetical protein
MSAGRNWAEVVAPIPIPQASAAGRGERRGEGLVYRREYEWRAYPDEAPPQEYRDDPSDPESPVLERPAPWWTPRSIGFRARILVNPLGGEVRHEMQTFLASLNGAGTEQDYLAAIADRVVAWEYVIVEEDGARTEVPPPAEGGWERFLDLPNDALIWLKEEIRAAHLPKATTRAGKPAGARASASPTPTDPDAAPPPS